MRLPIEDEVLRDLFGGMYKPYFKRFDDPTEKVRELCIVMSRQRAKLSVAPSKKFACGTKQAPRAPPQPRPRAAHD